MPSGKEVLMVAHDGWVELVLNRVDKGNALNMPMLDLLRQYTETLARDKSVRAVVLRGSGERFFCTGGDIEAWGSLTPHDMGRDWIIQGIEVFEKIAALPQVVVAAINGHTLGGGLELAMAADLRLAIRHAKFGNPEITLGMIPGWMGTRRLPEMIGIARARHLLLLGSPITAQQALDWGLITHMVENHEELEEALLLWITRICANGPSAAALIKGILASMHLDMRHHHASAVAQAAATEDCKEGVRAFIEKRKPVYQNR